MSSHSLENMGLTKTKSAWWRHSVQETEQRKALDVNQGNHPGKESNPNQMLKHLPILNQKMQKGKRQQRPPRQKRPILLNSL